MNSLFYKCRRTQGVEEVCLENKEERKSSRAFESFRRRGIIEKPSRGDTVLTNSLIFIWVCSSVGESSSLENAFRKPFGKQGQHLPFPPLSYWSRIRVPPDPPSNPISLSYKTLCYGHRDTGSIPVWDITCTCSSIGRVPDFQSGCCEIVPRHVLHKGRLLSPLFLSKERCLYEQIQ